MQHLQELVSQLKKHISPERYTKIQTVSRARTRYLIVVLNNVYYTQNISAVVRSCECLGIQDLYITGDSTPSGRINKHVAIGAADWVTIHRQHRVPETEVLARLQQEGYRLVAAVPDAQAVSLYDFNPGKGKIAVILGNETNGVSEMVRRAAGEFLCIPMQGFSDSFNVSVSAAIILAELMRKLHQSEDIPWQLTEKEILELQYTWIKSSLKRGEEIDKEYHRRLEHPNDQL